MNAIWMFPESINGLNDMDSVSHCDAPFGKNELDVEGAVARSAPDLLNISTP